MKLEQHPLKICLPIIESSLAAVLNAMSGAASEYQILEVWVDYIADFSEHSIDALLAASGGREILFLFRRQNLNEPKLSLTNRLSLISALIRHPQDNLIALDLDVRAQRAEVDWLLKQDHTNSLILSYHNYDATPEQSELSEIADEMTAGNATIYKFSTFCRSPTDALRLLEFLLYLRTQNKRCSVLGMGKDGLATRVFGPLWGSEIAYAPQVMANSSAPGQLTLAEFKQIFEQLEAIHER